tara:strand:+ start:1805 stop:2257 length:453 start_codon:yes stop_codon:yes gene_type:complete
VPKNCLKDECVNGVWGKGYCKYHQYLREDKRKASPIKKSKIKKVYKKTGELQLFKEIWEERTRVCFVSGETLKGFSVQSFAHILPKGSYPSLRLSKLNIVLLTPENHYKYDHQVDKAKEDSRFDKLFCLRQELTSEYYRKNKITNFNDSV